MRGGACTLVPALRVRLSGSGQPHPRLLGHLGLQLPLGRTARTRVDLLPQLAPIPLLGEAAHEALAHRALAPRDRHDQHLLAPHARRGRGARAASVVHGAPRSGCAFALRLGAASGGASASSAPPCLPPCRSPPLGLGRGPPRRARAEARSRPSCTRAPASAARPPGTRRGAPPPPLAPRPPRRSTPPPSLAARRSRHPPAIGARPRVGCRRRHRRGPRVQQLACPREAARAPR